MTKGIGSSDGLIALASRGQEGKGENAFIGLRSKFRRLNDGASKERTFRRREGTRQVNHTAYD